MIRHSALVADGGVSPSTLVGREMEEGVDEKRVIVTGFDGKTADEVVVTYDFNKNEVTVADKNEEHGYPRDDPVVEALYVETLDRQLEGWRELSLEGLREAAEDAKITFYDFPVSRVANPVEDGYDPR